MQNFVLKGQNFQLHPFKGIYWQEEKTLLIADLHLGKANHFRKAGIPVPIDVKQSNYDKFTALLLDFSPAKVLILGDLFHSDFNQSWQDMIDIIEQFKHIKFELVIGNHDIMELKRYKEAKLHLHDAVSYTHLTLPTILLV